jgi:hypothetical protein
VFVTTGYLSPEARIFANEHSSESERIDSVEISKELEAYDVEELNNVYESHLSPTRHNTDVELAILPEDRHISTLRVFA